MNWFWRLASRCVVAAMMLSPCVSTASGRQSGRASGRWLGQDGRDFVGPGSAPAPSDVQDIHIALVGLPRGLAVASARITALGGGEWVFKGPFGPWAAHVENDPASGRADLFLEPSQAETGRPFHVVLRFEDGRTAEVNVAGGRADPNLRMPGASMAARWIGQEQTDRVGTGPSVGPDGLVDARIALEKLSRGVGIAAITVGLAGKAGPRWRSGVNPDGVASAEMVRHADDPSRADLYLGLDRDLKGAPLAIAVAYDNGKADATRLVAGRCDPLKATPRGVLPVVETIEVKTRWLGQDGTDRVGPGDVHVVVEGVPTAKVAAAALSNASRGTWAVRLDDKPPFDPGPWSVPLSLERSGDPPRIDLRFPPFRDETGRGMMLRLLLEDGRTVVARFPGGKADPGLRASSSPATTSASAKPGDDLNHLASKFGTIRLATGRYPMDRPLILSRPVTITGEAGAVVVFSQAADAPTWPAAIKVHSGHTTLEGFAVRFASPIRWTPGVEGGPAVIGATDNTDPGPGDLKADLNFRGLDLEGPPAATKWEEAPRSIRLGHAICGSVERNILRGGSIDLEGGPWRIEANRYRGTMPGTFAYSVVSARRPHDLIVKDNRVKPEPGSGKTWRFLVLAGFGADDVIEGNTVSNVGPRDGDGIPDANAAEIVLTESYGLSFEGKPSAVSPGGHVLVVPGMQGEPASPGAVVAILTGPRAGSWRRIAQAMGPTSYILDEPLPPGEPIVSIADGFVGETFLRNAIDARGGSGAAGFVLAGNLFDARVVENQVFGAGEAFRMIAAPTEQPVHWGWSHAPMMGLRFEGNRVEDALQGVTIGVEHSSAVKTNRDRVYASALLKGNVYRWTGTSWPQNRRRPPAVTLGIPGGLDPSEFLVSAKDDRGDGQGVGVVKVVAARINDRVVRDETFRLSTSPAAIRHEARR